MKKLNFLTLILFAIIFSSASAQVPGYQGKRFSLGYNASSFFYLTNLNYSDGILGVFETTRLSYKTELQVNYVLSRKVAAGFSYYFAKQKDNFTIGEIQNYGNAMFPKDGIAICKLSIYEINFQFFRKNFIAPAGLYHQFSIGMVKYGLASADNKLTVYDNSYGSFPLVLDGPSDPFTCYKFGYAFGKKNPLGHNVYINTSFGINIFRGGDSLLLGESISGPTTQTYIRANLNRNLWTHNLFEVKIGLGWLAF